MISPLKIIAPFVLMQLIGTTICSPAVSANLLDAQELNLTTKLASETIDSMPAQLQLRWELKDGAFENAGSFGKSRAVFRFINKGKTEFPSKGWALYFNCNDGMQTGEVKGSLAYEHVVGNLFRLVPKPGFRGIAPGQSLDVDYFFVHPARMARIPSGPYLVFDDKPDKGYAIVDYNIAQLDKEYLQSVSDITPETIYKRNEKTRILSDDDIPPVFPTPLKLEKGIGKIHLTAMPQAVAGKNLRNEFAFAIDLLRPYLSPAKPGENRDDIKLRLLIGHVAGQQSPESYELRIDEKKGITVVGNSATGVFYGIQSLRDLLPLTPQPRMGLDLPVVKIVDSPRFDYRGFHFDVARNFQPKATVLKILDLMARYKLNKFHFHLTDDEGWRLEIRGLPELTSIASRRGHTSQAGDFLPPAYGSGPDVSDPHGNGYYSRAEYIDILKYAAARHIEVIPEIEMPGHARAVVMAMESRFRRLSSHDDPDAARYLLNDLKDGSEYKSPQLYTDNVMNPGLHSTYTFIDHVVSEIVAIYEEANVPLFTVHVGGDELPLGAWEKSPESSALMKKNNLKSTSELWDYFYSGVDKILGRYGLFTSGWEELGVRKAEAAGGANTPNPLFLARGFRLFVWNNIGVNAEDLAYRLANSGYQTVLAPVTNFYLDMAYNKNPGEPGVNWGGYIDLDTVYDFIPLDYYKNSGLPQSRFAGKEHLTKVGKEKIVGLEACLWTETVREEQMLDYLLMPRLLGFAERAWASDPTWAQEPDSAKAKLLYEDAWSGFANAIGKRLLPRLDLDGAKWQYRIPAPGLKVESGQVFSNFQLPGFALRYTTNDNMPTMTSPEVKGPIAEKGMIHMAAFSQTGRRGLISSVENR